MAQNLAPAATAANPLPSSDAIYGGAVPPTITMNATPSGTGHEEFALTITFSQSVLGFRADDIDLSAGDLSDFSGSGAAYTATIDPPADYEGTITVSIAKGAAISLFDEDNVAAAYSFYVDNVPPKLEDAFVEGGELVLVYDDDLNGAVAPDPKDFSVRVDGRTRSVSSVQVRRDEVTLTLNPSVGYRDEVVLSYTPGTRPLSDAVGNVVDALVREPVANRTIENAGAPSAPRSLSATADGSSAIDLDWTAPADSGSALVDGYRIEASSDAGSTWEVLVRDTRDAVTSYSDTGLSPLTTRHYRVLAINDFGVSEPSNTASATTTGRVPAAPTGLTTTAVGSSRIDLRWRASSGGSGGAVTGYRIEISDNGLSGWSTLVSDTRSTSTSYSDTGLAPGTRRFYRVSGINREGIGSPSTGSGATTQFAPPGQPTNLRATAASTNQINLSWSAPASDGGQRITGYVVESSSDGGTTWAVLVGNTGATTYSHRGLGPGTTRDYRVAAINSRGRGQYSGTIRAVTLGTVPGTPSNLRFVGLDASSITLAWNAPLTTGGVAISGYRIEVSNNAGLSWRLLVVTTAASTTYTHRNLQPATAYHYRVAAINQLGTGSFSPRAGATTAANVPGVPRDLMAGAVGLSRIDLDWDPPADDGGARITGYQIEVSEDRRRTWSVLEDVRGATRTSYSHTGLPPNTTRHYRVSAVNRAGTGQPSSVVFATTAADLPGAPTGLGAVADGTSRINLAWTAPSYTGGVPLIGYRIEVSEDRGSSWSDLVSKTRSATTTYSHTGLRPGSTRYYRVSAINQVGAGDPSGVSVATTVATVPYRPTGLTATADGTARIDLSWTAPAFDGGARITGYRIEVSENGGGTWTDLTANTHSANTTYSHTGLDPATTRYYRVSAVNSVGTGDPSSIASATTDATVPDAPTNLMATASEPTRIDLTWTAPGYDGGAAITGYRIEVSEDGVVWANLAATITSATTYSHNGLPPGSTRHYRVSATNSAGTGMPSAAASATTDDHRGRTGRVSERILSHAAAAMTSSTVSAIASRVDAVASGVVDRGQMSMGGVSSLAGSPVGRGTGLFGSGRHGMATAGSLIDGMSFVLPVGNQSVPAQEGVMSTLATWGGGEYVSMGETGATEVDWSGNVVNLHVGADVRVRPDILAGVAATTSSGSFDFADQTGDDLVSGTYDSRLTTINPYAAWLMDDPGSVAWASGGYGWGEIEIEDELEALRSAGTRMLTGAVGGSRSLLASSAGGVRVRGEGWLARVTLSDSEASDSLTLDMQRVRLLLEWSQRYRSAAGDEIAFLLEGGMRYDGGSGPQGTGVEIGSGMRFVNAALGMRLEGRGRVLVAGREGYDEWGVGGILQIDPAIKGEGLSVRVAPTWGVTTGGAQELWERGVSEMRPDDRNPLAGRLDAEVAYGLRGFGGTPYGGVLIADRGSRAYSSGLRYELGRGLGLRVEATRRESHYGPPQHTIGVRGRLHF